MCMGLSVSRMATPILHKLHVKRASSRWFLICPSNGRYFERLLKNDDKDNDSGFLFTPALVVRWSVDSQPCVVKIMFPTRRIYASERLSLFCSAIKKRQVRRALLVDKILLIGNYYTTDIRSMFQKKHARYSLVSFSLIVNSKTPRS